MTLALVWTDEARRRSGLRIRAIRRALGMTAIEFCYYLRIGSGTLSRWENGHAMPRPVYEQAIRNLCAEHGLDLNTMRRFG